MRLAISDLPCADVLLGRSKVKTIAGVPNQTLRKPRRSGEAAPRRLTWAHVKLAGGEETVESVRGYGLMVFAIEADAISAITGFADPGLSDYFGLPAWLPAVKEG